MASSPDRSNQSNLENGCDEVFLERLVWAWVPAENEPREELRLKQDGETEPWVSWHFDGGEINSERRPETASGLGDSSAECDEY